MSGNPLFSAQFRDSPENIPSRAKRPFHERAIKAAAEAAHVSESEILSGCRAHRIAIARFIAMQIMRDNGMTLQQIAGRVNRHWTTVRRDLRNLKPMLERNQRQARDKLDDALAIMAGCKPKIAPPAPEPEAELVEDTAAPIPQSALRGALGERIVTRLRMASEPIQAETLAQQFNRRTEQITEALRVLERKGLAIRADAARYNGYWTAPKERTAS